MNKEFVDFKFWSTSITRFNAAKRVTSWKHCIRWSLLATSIYLTILSILLYSNKISETYNDLSQFASIFLSIVMLCLSLIVNLNQLEVKAFQFHECGRKIRKLLNNLSKENDNAKINDLLKMYDKILDQYENHSSIDYYQFVMQNRSDFNENQKSKIPPFYLLYIWMPIVRFVPQLLLYLITVIFPMIFMLKVTNFISAINSLILK